MMTAERIEKVIARTDRIEAACQSADNGYASLSDEDMVNDIATLVDECREALDALRAAQKEIEEVTKLGLNFKLLQAENARLKAELEAAQNTLAHFEDGTLISQIVELCDTERRLKAELEHMRADAGDDSCAAYAIENERLRAALEKYADHKNWIPASPCRFCEYHTGDICRCIPDEWQGPGDTGYETATKALGGGVGDE